MKRGIALLAVLVFLSCTAAGYLYIQRTQEPEVQEEQVEQTEPVAKEEAVIGENAEMPKISARIAAGLWQDNGIAAALIGGARMIK